jgi:hypothetical protein
MENYPKYITCRYYHLFWSGCSQEDREFAISTDMSLDDLSRIIRKAYRKPHDAKVVLTDYFDKKGKIVKNVMELVDKGLYITSFTEDR